LLPDRSQLKQIIEVIVVLPLLILSFVTISGKYNVSYHGLNLGLVFFVSMSLILIIGNLNNFIVKFIYPTYGENISLTNYYWMGGMIMFAVGFLNKAKCYNQEICNYKFIKVPLPLVYLLFILGTSATFYSVISLGFIPFFSGVGTGLRYTGNIAESTIAIRIFSLNVLASILAFQYFYTIKRNPIILMISIISLLFSLLFIVRIYTVMIVVTIFLLIIASLKKRRELIILAVISIALFGIGNNMFIDHRIGDHYRNKIIDSQELNIIHKILYTTFNEYRQLNIALNDYNAAPQYGKTLLAIPVGFIPAPVLSIVEINKNEIQRNNSAILMAKYLQSITSSGIRIGILGEFYVNFKYFGFLFMYFIGTFIGYIQNQVNRTCILDYKFGFYLLFFTITLYSLIGQIDAIGSLLANYLLLFFGINFLFRQIR
jgi:hypothetical protein